MESLEFSTLETSLTTRRLPESGNADFGFLQTTSQDEPFPFYSVICGSSFHYGDYIATDTRGKTIKLPLVNSDLISAPNIAAAYTISYKDAVVIREGLEVAFLDAFFARTMPLGAIVRPSEEVRQRLVQMLGVSNGLSPKNIEDALDRYCNGELEDHPNRVERREYARAGSQPPQQDLYQVQHHLRSTQQRLDEVENHLREAQNEAAEQHRHSTDGTSTNEQDLDLADDPDHPGDGQQFSGEANQGNIDEATQIGRSPTETVASHSWQGDAEEQGDHKKQTVLGLIYHIAEEQAKKEGYIHRVSTLKHCLPLPVITTSYLIVGTLAPAQSECRPFRRQRHDLKSRDSIYGFTSFLMY